MSLSDYIDLVTTTGPAFFTSADEVVNEMVKHNYLLSYVLRGNDAKTMIQGGDEIQDIILLDDAGEFQFYGTNPTFTPQNKQVSTLHKAYWRFSKFNYTVSDPETVLQSGDGSGDRAVFQKYKNLQRLKEQAAWTGGLNGMEDALTYTAPVTGDMEAQSGTQPYNLFAFISEDATNYHPSGWTTIENIDPATETRWRNQRSTYDDTIPLDATSGIFAAFDEMIEKVRFKAPGKKGEFFEPDTTTAKMKILTSLQGKTIYKRALRAANDRLVGGSSPQDPNYSNPKYDGIDVEYIDNLSTAPVYTSAAEAANEPRYYFVNFNYIKAFFHRKKFFAQVAPPRSTSQPFSVTVYFDCYWNLFCRSRYRQGIIAPVSPAN